MTLAKRYNTRTREPAIARWWQDAGVYDFDPTAEGAVFSIDSPPPTVSGKLHLGHIYSYSHADYIARYRRMRGDNVFYPMGFDDNGLPTERLVEKREGVHAQDIGREAFVKRCLAIAEEAEAEYREIWRRLGLSVDWRYTYRTIDENAQRLAQWSFLDLYRKGLAYRQKAPAIWCPECQTAIAQAEVDDLERDSTFFTLAFTLEDGESLPIATTRPELLPACVAIFIHPEDPRAPNLLNRRARVPIFGQRVPIMADPAADPEKGTGIVMCCTFGDSTDVAWQRDYDLPIVEAIGQDGRMLTPAGPFAGMTPDDARRDIILRLRGEGDLLKQHPVSQSVRVHERCGTPVEYILTRQWFIRVLDHKQAFLDAGEKIEWRPSHMKNRYRQWVENLAWDWCISRQRFHGVPFPLWHCSGCGEVLLADEAELPLNPRQRSPVGACKSCGATSFEPETDVMDTWATSSLSPQLVGGMFTDPALYERVTPFSMRPQAHEIIRTWAFYTIVKSHFHFGEVPWRSAVISGWALAPAGGEKISKSKGGGPVAPEAMMNQYSADALRYWAAGTSLGKDATVDEERIQAGQKLVTKLWHVARFCSRFLEGYVPPAEDELLPALTLADRWILARAAQLGRRLATLLDNYDYANARSELEQFFWKDLADNYLEMAKKRLYDGGQAAAGARYTLYSALLAAIKFFAPFLPYVTEAIYQGVFESDGSIHLSRWPERDPRLPKAAPDLEVAGEALIEIATAVRRYKSENNMALGAELAELQIARIDPALRPALRDAEADLLSITRAHCVRLVDAPDPAYVLDEAYARLPTNGQFQLAVRLLSGGS